jgi:short-subunit dehydrogenase
MHRALRFGSTLVTRWYLLVLILSAPLHLTGCASSRPLQTEDLQAIGGKTYVITGASSGFGRGVAQKLGALKANVVLAARRTQVLEDVAREVRAAGGNALVVTTDVSRPEEMRRLAEAAVSRYGKIDVWINNAGVGGIGRFEDIPLEDHARIIDVNLKGVIYGSHIAMQRFRQQGFGHLVNMGSIESEIPLAYQATYASSKAGVLSLGRALNEEIRQSQHAGKIAVSTVMPWATDTPFFEHTANYSGGTPRMVAMDDPQKVVDAVVRVSLYPQEELPVGWKAAGGNISHKLAPDLTERMSGKISDKVQMENAPPAPPTSGNLHRPLSNGTAVDGGVRQRMKAEDAQRKQEKK